MNPIRVAILTVSDRCAAGLRKDASGPAVAELAATALHGQVVAAAVVPDEVPAIGAKLTAWVAELAPDLILTTGGTGLAPRDVTPEATLAILTRHHAGLLELARMRCYARSPRAYLSRGHAGTVGQTLIINLPGSPSAATEMLGALIDILPHAIQALRGEVPDHGRATVPVRPKEGGGA